MTLDELMEVYSDMFETMGEWLEQWQALFDLWSPFRPADGVVY